MEEILALARSLGTLAAGKIKLAEQEITEDSATLVKVVGIVLAGALFAVLSLGLLGAGLALVIAPWIGSTGLALLLVGGIYLLTGIVLALAARSKIRKMGGLLSETRADLKRDAEWLKNLT
jgi:uncharacterized membrane protein YqjE